MKELENENVCVCVLVCVCKYVSESDRVRKRNINQGTNHSCGCQGVRNSLIKGGRDEDEDDVNSKGSVKVCIKQ